MSLGGTPTVEQVHPEPSAARPTVAQTEASLRAAARRAPYDRWT